MPRIVGNGLNLSSTKIINLADGSAPSDAATYGQLQALITGLAWKNPVRAASTTNVTLTAPGSSIDGVSLAVGDRLLLKNQTTATDNGIYVWTGASTTLTRATDADSGTELAAAAVFVREGTANADRAFTQTADNVTIGTTPIVFTQFGGMTSYTAGNGINISGTTVTAVAGTGILVGAGGISVDTSIVARKYAQNIGDGSSTTLTVTHSLGTTDITYSLSFVSTGEFFEADVVKTGANTLTVTTAAALAAGSARIVVTG